MCHKKDFPRYDDIFHIDTNAAPAHSSKHPPRIDPDMTSYTEMYCQPGACVEPQPTQENKH